MTLVLNRPQLLNGNNYIIIVFLSILGFTSCAAQKIKASKSVEVVPIKTNTAPAVSDISTTKTKEDSIIRKPTIFDIDNPVKENNIPTPISAPKIVNNDPDRIHNVAVILPFFLDQISLGQYVDDSTKQLSADSKNAMEFYLGCQLAREQFESEHLQTNVYFLDDKNDSSTMASLFKLKPFPNVDYIIGPIYSKNLRVAADLAKNYQIPMISPLANSMYIKDNPYYFNAVASLKSQYVYILEQIKNKFPAKMVEVLYDGQDSTAESINILKTLADKYYTYTGIKYTSLQAWNDAAKILSQPDTISERVVLIYSSKDSYVKSVIAKLKPIKNHLQIFTSSCVKNTKALVDTKNPHTIYTAYPFNNDNPNFSAFALKYEGKYSKKPTEIANQGYDLMMHLFYVLDKNQTLQDNTYNYTADFDNTQTKFQFKPVLNKNVNVDYYDNTFLYLYRYVNGIFSIATP